MDLLEPHITSGLGVSFKADNDNYLSVVRRRWDGNCCFVAWAGLAGNVEACKSAKDTWCKFDIEKIDKEHVYLKCPGDDLYLSRYTRAHQHIESAKAQADEFCKFKVIEEEGKVIFQADNGKFLSRMSRNGQFAWDPYIEDIEAAKGGIDKHCRFIVETGSLTPVTEEIIDIAWGEFTNPENLNTTVLDTKEAINRTSNDLKKTVSFVSTVEKSQSTSWENSWGLTVGTSASATVTGGVASGTFTISAEVRYDGKEGSSKTTTETVELTDTTEVTVPPYSKTTIKFMAAQMNNAEIPFTATIKRTSELEETEIKQKGTWKGVMVVNSWIEVIEAKMLA